jgi:AcrR family transcriptional regulator
MGTPESRDLRQQILSTATRLFIQYGYHGLSMRQISEALNVSKAALYYHFKDKEELYLAVLETYLDEMKLALDQILAESTSSKEKIRRFVEYVLAQPTEQRAIIRLASQEMGHLSAPTRQAFNLIYHQKFLGKIETIFITGIEQGELKKVNPEVATWALLGMMYPYFYPAHSGNGALSKETVQDIITIYLEGISSH